jgi:hypothetical protein
MVWTFQKNGESHCKQCGQPIKWSPKTCDSKEHIAYYLARSEDNKRYWRKHLPELERQIWEHYGNRCGCCGMTDSRFFTLGHPNNDGAIQRKTTRTSGWTFYRWLVLNNFPTTYELEIQCWNCNMAQKKFGICPHRGVPK